MTTGLQMIHNMMGCLLEESAALSGLLKAHLEDEEAAPLSKQERRYLTECLEGTLAYLKQMKASLNP